MQQHHESAQADASTSNESGFYDACSPDLVVVAPGARRRSIKRHQSSHVPTIHHHHPPPAKKPALDDPHLADVLSTAQRECVWPQADPKLTLDERVLRQLTAREAQPLQDYCAHVQREVQPYMRRIVVDWMGDVSARTTTPITLQVCADARVDMEVLPLAVNYLDRFLSVEQIYQTQLQALATACLWLASKIKMPKPFESARLCQYTDSAVEMGPLMVRACCLSTHHLAELGATAARPPQLGRGVGDGRRLPRAVPRPHASAAERGERDARRVPPHPLRHAQRWVD